MTFARVDPNNAPPLPAGFVWNNGVPTYNPGGGALNTDNGPNFYQAQGLPSPVPSMYRKPAQSPYGLPYAPRSQNSFFSQLPQVTAGPGSQYAYNYNHGLLQQQQGSYPQQQAAGTFPQQSGQQSQYPFQFPTLGLGNFYTPHQPGQAQMVPNSGPMANFIGNQWPQPQQQGQSPYQPQGSYQSPMPMGGGGFMKPLPGTPIFPGAAY